MVVGANNGMVMQGIMTIGDVGKCTMISKTYWSKTDYSSGQPKQESYQ